MGKKLQKIYLTYYKFVDSATFIAQAHYQILSIIFLKEFIKLNVNTSTMIKNVKLVELHSKCATVFFNTQTLKII